MAEIAPYTPLRTIISYFMDETDKSVGDEDRYWILGMRALTAMNYSFSGQTQTVRLPISPNFTVPFPTGLLSWSKIGLLDENGKINTLKINRALTTYADNNPNRLTAISNPEVNSNTGALALVPYYANYYYGGGCYQLYGLGNGVITYGECNVDELNRVIILPPDFKQDSILVEGIFTPQWDNDFQVPTCLQEAIIAWIKWKLKLGPREEYIAAAIEGRRSLPKKKFILQTINQVIRESESFKLRS